MTTNAPNLVLDPPQPEGGVAEDEEDGKDDAGEEHQHAAELVDQEVSDAEGAEHGKGGMVLLQVFNWNLKQELLVRWMVITESSAMQGTCVCAQ
jgi:hypothetical protein